MDNNVIELNRNRLILVFAPTVCHWRRKYINIGGVSGDSAPFHCRTASLCDTWRRKTGGRYLKLFENINLHKNFRLSKNLKLHQKALFPKYRKADPNSSSSFRSEMFNKTKLLITINMHARVHVHVYTHVYLHTSRPCVRNMVVLYVSIYKRMYVHVYVTCIISPYLWLMPESTCAILTPCSLMHDRCRGSRKTRLSRNWRRMDSSSSAARWSHPRQTEQLTSVQRNRNTSEWAGQVDSSGRNDVRPGKQLWCDTWEQRWRDAEEQRCRGTWEQR